MPDFAEKYTNYMMEQVRASGASRQVIDAKMQELKNFNALYDNPLFNAAITFLEPFPIGLIISLISAAILRRRKAKDREPVVGEPLPALSPLRDISRSAP